MKAIKKHPFWVKIWLFSQKKSSQSSGENNHFSKYEKLPLNCWKSRNPNMFVDFHKIFSYVCEWKKELTLGWVINVCVEWQHDFDQKFGRQKKFKKKIEKKN